MGERPKPVRELGRAPRHTPTSPQVQLPHLSWEGLTEEEKESDWGAELGQTKAATGNADGAGGVRRAEGRSAGREGPRFQPCTRTKDASSGQSTEVISLRPGGQIRT